MQCLAKSLLTPDVLKFKFFIIHLIFTFNVTDHKWNYLQK